MLVFYTNFGVVPGAGASTRGPFIFIRPEHRGDIGLLEHEKVHRRQWLRTLGLHSFLYLLSDRYRLAAEVEAFKVQLGYAPHALDRFAHFLAAHYGIDGLTPEQARALLTEGQS